MANSTKETIYVDIDDEITAIIDKVKSSDKKIVALVLPKRAAVLQSIVNMKLLKRTADDAKKSLVLITSEAGVLPLAGAVGVHVAKTLQSKPAIPTAPKTDDKPVAVGGDELEDVDLDSSKPIGELADDEPIEVDNEDKPEDSATDKAAAKKTGKSKKLKIPNFDKFRLKVVLGVLALIIVLVGLFFATQVLPQARVVVKTDSTSINSEIKLTASPAATAVSEDGTVVPATVKELKKTDSESVTATGEIDRGEKAKGKVTLKLKNCNTEEITIPAGTGVSNNNLTFITQESATLQSVKVGSNCQNDSFPAISSKTVNVVAQAGGDKYNLSAGRTFTVAGFSSVSGEDSTAMSGGTSNITKVVSQKDIDDARQKVQDRSDASRDSMLADLEAEGYIGLRETFATKGEPVVTANPKLNEPASNVTVSVVTTYTILGVKKDDLKALVEKSVEGKYDKEKQVILDNGLDDARVVLDEKKANGEAVITLRTVVLAGPQLDENAIKNEVAGKKKNQALTAVRSRPGIKEAEISYSPFWVSSTPKKTSKITVVFEQNQAETDDGNE